MKKAVLFDFDGTLVDSQILYDIAASESLLTISPKYTHEFCAKYFHGRGWKDVFDEIAKLEPKTDVMAVRDNALVIAGELTKNKIKPVKNARKVLESLARSGTKMAICSNAPLHAIKRHLVKCELEEFFCETEIFAMESVKEAKPSPEIYLKAMKHFEFETEDCIVIEDSLAGLKSASFAGIDALLFKGASHHKKNGETAKNILESLKKLENNTLKGEIDDFLEILKFV